MDLKMKQEVLQEMYEENLSPDDYLVIGEDIEEVSAHIVYRIEATDPRRTVKKIKITYLIEQNSYNAWFIGTEFCYAWYEKVGTLMGQKSQLR